MGMSWAATWMAPHIPEALQTMTAHSLILAAPNIIQQKASRLSKITEDHRISIQSPDPKLQCGSCFVYSRLTWYVAVWTTMCNR